MQDNKNKTFAWEGIKAEANNYRPISLLHLIPKVIEKSVHNQTQDYLQSNELFYIHQSGFRANRFTDIYLSQLTSIILDIA